MTFINLILFIIVGVSITNLVVNASIFDFPRNSLINILEKIKYFDFITKLITCMMCSGFWVGVILSLDFSEINAIYGGAIISICSYVFDSIMEYIEMSIIVVDNNIEEAEE